MFNDMAHAKDLSISEEERKFAADGNRKAFWESRLNRGDPLAQTALDIVNDKGWGWVANRNAEFGMWAGDSSANLQQLGVDLMRAHVSAVDFDYSNNIGTVPGSLSVGQIRDYHYEVFDNLSISRWAYGGTPGPLGVGWTDSVYCSGCDPKGSGIR